MAADSSSSGKPGGIGRGALPLIPNIDDPVELRHRGFRALVDALGWLNAVRFLQQYERGEGDYTKERRDLLPDWDDETLVRKSHEAAKQN